MCCRRDRLSLHIISNMSQRFRHYRSHCPHSWTSLTSPIGQHMSVRWSHSLRDGIKLPVDRLHYYYILPNSSLALPTLWWNNKVILENCEAAGRSESELLDPVHVLEFIVYKPMNIHIHHFFEPLHEFVSYRASSTFGHKTMPLDNNLLLHDPPRA